MLRNDVASSQGVYKFYTAFAFQQAAEDDDLSSTDLHDLFHVGQFIPTIVKALDSNKHGYKKISLSVDPKELNARLKAEWVIEDMVCNGAGVVFGLKSN